METLELEVAGLLSAKANGTFAMSVLLALFVIYLGYKLIAARWSITPMCLTTLSVPSVASTKEPALRAEMPLQTVLVEWERTGYQFAQYRQ